MMHSSLFLRLGVVLSALVGGAVLAVPSSALACKCMFPEVAPAREAATAVFEGRVTAIEDVPAEGDVGIGQKRVTLTLVRTWKGLDNKESVMVRTNAESASCGYTFEANTSYLVYAGGTDTDLDVSGCSRTRPMSDAADDLAILGAGITPVEVKALPVTPTAAAKPTTPEAALPETAPRTAGCACTSSTARASASALLFPVTGLVFGARRRKRR